MLFYAEVFEHLVQCADRQPDHVVIVALDPFHELGRHALDRIPSGLVVPFRLVAVVCMPYTTAGFNWVPCMAYAAGIL